MAIRPNDGEVFLKEVDEELRRDQLNRFARRYGWAIVAAIILVLGAIGGWIWWQARQEAAAAAEGEALLEALDAIENGNRNAAAPKIAALAESGRDGYRAAALFTRAGTETEAGNIAAAVATLRAIADNADFAEPYRQAALVRQTALEFDSLPPQAVIQRLRPLVRPGEPWLGSAGEMVGVAHIKMGRPDLAGPVFAQIARDETVPPTIRTRAVQMAGSLGVNALEEPNAPAQGQPSGRGDQAATREKAE